MKLFRCFVLGMVIGIPAYGGAGTVLLGGTWNLTLNAANLTVPNTGGYNFTSTYSSLASGTGGPIWILTFGGGGPPWTISVSKSDVSWPTGVGLSISIAAPVPASIILNNSPVTIDGISRVFYRVNAIAIITVYYQMSGVTVVNLAAANYSTVVTYTATAP